MWLAKAIKGWLQSEDSVFCVYCRESTVSVILEIVSVNTKNGSVRRMSGRCKSCDNLTSKMLGGIRQTS